eukprot:3077486-Prymnesium_polylepis.1
MADAAGADAEEVEAEISAAGLEQQGVALLQKQYPTHSDPTHSEQKCLDQWAGGLDDDGVFEGCNVVH